MYTYQRLKDLREDKDLSQTDIAKILDTTQKQYSRWETGEYEIPFHNVIKLAKFYNVTIDFIANITNLPSTLPKKWGMKMFNLAILEQPISQAVDNYYKICLDKFLPFILPTIVLTALAIIAPSGLNFCMNIIKNK